MLELDGSYGSGGGQMLRTALAFSTLTGIPFKMSNIRSGRKNPGLKQQHLTCIQALEMVSGAKVLGDELASSEITFIPGRYKAANVEIDIKTAGSITLLLQSLLLPAIFSDKKHSLTIIGGTDVMWSPPVDYFIYVFLPQIKRFCNDIDIFVKKRGFHPKGGGIIELVIDPSIKRDSFDNFINFKKSVSSVIGPYSLSDTPNLISINGNISVSSDLLDKDVGVRISDAIKSKLSSLNVPISIACEYNNSLSSGVSATLWAKLSTKDEFDPLNPILIGADLLGEKKVSAEKVGENLADKLLKELDCDCCVDEHLADNLIPFMALLPGSNIKVGKISDHTLTNMFIVESFIGKVFRIKDNLIEVIKK